jgi:hypothetical protein
MPYASKHSTSGRGGRGSWNGVLAWSRDEDRSDEVVGGCEAVEVGHGLQVPDDDAWFHMN